MIISGALRSFRRRVAQPQPITGSPEGGRSSGCPILEYTCAAAVSLEATFDQDHAPFVVVGAPAFSLRVEPGEYDIHHHAITDTFDEVDPRLLAFNTAVMGAAAWSFADAPNPVGPRLSEAEAEAVMKKSGVASTRRMLYGSSRR